MATHDYVIDNSTGANVRADLNLVLQAILSNNSSSSAPSTTAAYMWWADTTNGILKIRNSANNDWVELLQLDGTLTLEDGSASTPGLAFRDDLNTGIFSSAADTFNVATGGTERMELGTTTIFNEDGADVDFRIEGDSEANLFYVDAGNDRIGIGTDAPQNLLHLAKGDSDKCVLQFTNSTTGVASGDGFQIGLSSGEVGLLNMKENAGIEFKTNDTLRMTIDSSGNVGIGTTSPDTPLTVARATTGLCLKGLSTNNNTRAQLDLTGKDASGNAVTMRVGGDGDFGGMLFTHTNHKLGFATNNAAPQMVLDTSGNVKITSQHLEFDTTGKGIIFGIEGGSNRPSIVGNYTSSTNNNIAFNVTGSERMRIDSSGDILFGTTSGGNTNAYFEASSQNRSILHIGSSSTNTATIVVFRNPNNVVGTIQTNGTSTAFNTSSDYRLKENAVAISDGITRLKTLKPYRFNFKADAGKTVDGFFAHEVTAVPEAISGTKDEVVTQAMIDAGDYKEGTLNDPIYQGIDQSKLVPLLVAAVKELITKVEALEAA